MARIINAGSDAVAYECVPRPTCPACGAEWNDEMIELFEMGFMTCNCCPPLPYDPEDVVCHACKKVLYSVNSAPAAEAPKPGEFDMTPRE